MKKYRILKKGKIKNNDEYRSHAAKAEGEALRLLKEFKATYDCQRLDNRFDDVLIAFEQWLKSRREGR